MGRLQQILARPWVPAAIGKAPYLWSVSLVFFFLKYTYSVPSAREVVAVAATLAVFFPLYFGSFWFDGKRLQAFVLALFVLGAIWAPFNQGASTFFIFAAARCGGMSEQRRAFVSLAALTVGATLVAACLDKSLEFLFPVFMVGLPVGLGSIMEGGQRQARERLMRKQEEVEHMATIAERERISRDLHDLLGHTLSLITLKAELAGKLINRDIDACRSEIKDIETSARHALGEVRAAVSGYRESGFGHELAKAKASLDAAQVTLRAQVHDVAWPASAENVLALALREAVTNILRHSNATACDLSLSRQGGQIVLTIADNGNTLAPGKELRRGNGLLGMQERVHALGGRLALRFEQGMALELYLPMGEAS